MTSNRSEAVLLPGNDLDAGFYAGLGAALERRGVRVTVPALAERSWPALVAAARAATGGAGTLIGHSLGALTALLVAAEAPPALRGLVLLEPIIAPSRALARGLARTYLREVVHGDRTRFRNGGALFRRIHDLARFPEAAIDRYLEVRRTSDPETAAALFRGLPDLYPLPLARVRLPTLVVRGARSGVFARLAQAALVARLPQARARTLPRAGHWVANEADEAAAKAIAAFVGYPKRTVIARLPNARLGCSHMRVRVDRFWVESGVKRVRFSSQAGGGEAGWVGEDPTIEMEYSVELELESPVSVAALDQSVADLVDASRSSVTLRGTVENVDSDGATTLRVAGGLVLVQLAQGVVTPGMPAELQAPALTLYDTNV